MIQTESGRRQMIADAQADGMIRIVYHLPPTGILGPNAKTEAGHVYQVFAASGSKLVGGSHGPDRARVEAYARKVATEKGIHAPLMVDGGTWDDKAGRAK